LDRWPNLTVTVMSRPSRAAPRSAQGMPATTARARDGLARVPREPRLTRFTVAGHHVAKLDRFVSHAQRAAARAGREFEGVSVEVDAQGVVSVHAIGMASMLLSDSVAPRTPNVQTLWKSSLAPGEGTTRDCWRRSDTQNTT
jgi:hypothetical protein